MALRMRQDNPTFYDQTHEWRVTFYPLKKNECPGFSHKVIINSRPAGWLGAEFRPSGKTAAYFLEKFGPYIEAQLAQASSPPPRGSLSGPRQTSTGRDR